MTCSPMIRLTPPAAQWLAATALAALLATPALAGKATVESADGGSASFEYRDRMLRINTEEPGAYIVLRDGIMYVVNIEGDKPMVFNASSMMRGLAQNAVQFAPEDLSADFESMEDTGRDETVAGIRGDVYLMSYTDEKGRRQQQEIVLSGSDEAREFREALFSMVEVAGEMAGEQVEMENRELQDRLDSLDAGVLRVGEDMRVTAISGETIAAARFELPAEPMNMEGIGSMLGSALSQQPQQGEGEQQGGAPQGGLLGGMLGAFGKQSAEGEEAAAEEAEQAEEEGKNNPFKAFGKMFKKKDN